MDNFPTQPALDRGESPSLYSNKAEDTSIKADTDGGYEFRRERNTRVRRRMIETGFLKLTNASFNILDAFFDEHGLTKAFIWFDQVRGKDYQVCFDEFTPDYNGIGKNRMWDVKIKMSEI